MKVVIPGGGGFLGRALARSFLDSGDEVLVVLPRSGQAPVDRCVEWDVRTMGGCAREIDEANETAGGSRFEFQFTKWNAAVNDLISRTR